MSHSMSFPINKNYSPAIDSSNLYKMGSSSMSERDNIYAQYKPALSRENSMRNEYPPTNLSLVVEPKKMDFDVLMK